MHAKLIETQVFDLIQVIARIRLAEGDEHHPRIKDYTTYRGRFEFNFGKLLDNEATAQELARLLTQLTQLFYQMDQIIHQTSVGVGDLTVSARPAVSIPDLEQDVINLAMNIYQHMASKFIYWYQLSAQQKNELKIIIAEYPVTDLENLSQFSLYLFSAYEQITKEISIVLTFYSQLGALAPEPGRFNINRASRVTQDLLRRIQDKVFTSPAFPRTGQNGEKVKLDASSILIDELEVYLKGIHTLIDLLALEMAFKQGLLFDPEMLKHYSFVLDGVDLDEVKQMILEKKFQLNLM